MQAKRWCVHFSDGTRLEVEATHYFAHNDGSLQIFWPSDEAETKTEQMEKGSTMLRAAPGEWRYFHAIGEDGCQVDRPKYEMKRVLEGAEGVKRTLKSQSQKGN